MTRFSHYRTLLPLILFSALIGLQACAFSEKTQNDNSAVAPNLTDLKVNSGPFSYVRLSLAGNGTDSAKVKKSEGIFSLEGSTSLHELSSIHAAENKNPFQTEEVPMVLKAGKQEFSGWSLPFKLELTLKTDAKPVDVQLVLKAAQAAGSKGSCTLSLTPHNEPTKVLSQVVDGVEAPHQASLILPKRVLENGGTYRFKISGDKGCDKYLVSDVTAMPMQIYSTETDKKIGVLSTSLFAQFGEINSVQAVVNPSAASTQGSDLKDPINTAIWTRGYGLADDAIMLPGPTFYFKPGDILTVNLVNKMNRDSLNALNAFENAQSAALNKDDVLDGQGSVLPDGEFHVTDAIKHEVNIPHNLNNTNLHVHGLHVDPEKDDVTIVVIPDSEVNEAEYDAPAAYSHQKGFVFPTKVSELDIYNEGSVADRPVVSGNWGYQYKIPDIHLPGTHWFHPHKHGSTSSQVENGMAGSIVIQEETSGSPAGTSPSGDVRVNNAIITGFPSDAERVQWEENHDSVLMIQEIANYGVQRGSGDGQGNRPGIDVPTEGTAEKAGGASPTPTITINGLQNPTFELKNGQLQRWRLVNAGANHKAFSHIWLGKKISGGTNPVYRSTPIYLVAVDGITLAEKVEITAEKPLLLAPGNRADILVQISDAGDYTLYKYYPQTVSVQDAAGHLIWDCSKSTQKTNKCKGEKTGTLAAAEAPVSNPYLFAQTGVGAANGVSENFAGFKRKWNAQGEQSIIPIIKVKPDSSKNLLDLDVAFEKDFPNKTAQEKPELIGRWQPKQASPGGTGPLPAALFNIKVAAPSNDDVLTFSPELPTDTHLANIHLKDKYGKTAKYVNPIKNENIFQSRPVIFDVSNAKINVAHTSDPSLKLAVSQFTLNSRPFALNDPVGNATAAVNERIKHGVQAGNADPEVMSQRLKEVDVGNAIPDREQKAACLNEKVDTYNNQEECELNIAEVLSIEGSGQTPNWSNLVDDQYFWTNASYYQSIAYNETRGYFYQAIPRSIYSPNNNVQVYPSPSWKLVSGLDHEAVVNKGFVNPEIDVHKMTGSSVPGLPVATTAEEWILINNSDVGHPFHIHINPFFVTEVGQLSYEEFTDLSVTLKPSKFKQWVIRAASVNDLPSCDPSVPVSTDPLLPNCSGVEKDSSILNDDIIQKFDGNSAVMVNALGQSQFVGNWWDTVIIPPHGYVKIRYWFNVPNQTDAYNPLTGTGAESCKVADDDNKLGIWVYHCHILRHEDRGMMQPVITQPYIPVKK